MVTKSFCLIKHYKILRTYKEVLVDVIWVMKILNNYEEKRGKTIILTFVLTDLKRKIKGDIVSVMKVKTDIQNVLLKRIVFD